MFVNCFVWFIRTSQPERDGDVLLAWPSLVLPGLVWHDGIGPMNMQMNKSFSAELRRDLVGQ